MHLFIYLSIYLFLYLFMYLFSYFCLFLHVCVCARAHSKNVHLYISGIKWTFRIVSGQMPVDVYVYMMLKSRGNMLGMSMLIWLLPACCSRQFSRQSSWAMLSCWRGHNICILLQRRMGDVRVHEQETILPMRGLGSPWITIDRAPVGPGRPR